MAKPGEKVQQNGFFRREVIGPPECPIIIRWTLINTRWGKLLLHRFPAYADDRAVHDHPCSFWTFVFRGGYYDKSPCDGCGQRPSDPVRCDGFGNIVDRVFAPAIRFRPSTHKHITECGPKGAWSLVLMGPKVREWGFWRFGRWMRWDKHELLYGYGMRCPDDR